MEFRRETVRSELRLPGQDAPTELAMETRWDPLTGHTSRLVTGTTLLPDTAADVAEVVARTRQGCPFCPEVVESVTPRFATALGVGDRIRVGEALVFPNLLSYSQYSSVGVYGPERHALPLAELTPTLVRDNLLAQTRFLRGVRGAYPAANWTSVNANHLPPSGSSLYHPHTQAAAHPAPTTMQRMLADVPAQAYEEFLAAERRSGERYLGDVGRVRWLTAFAPVAPAEIRAFVPGVGAPEQLDDDTVADLAAGLAAALRVYGELGASSFNLALYGAPAERAGYPLNLRLACRSGLAPYYRSDAMYLERLHWEAATGFDPEELAERARPLFR